MWNKVGKYTILFIGAFIIITFLVIGAYPAAVRSITGLAVAQSDTQWNRLKDAAFGDNATDGIGAYSLYLFDGTNFDRARGDTTNGLEVDVTRTIPGTGATALGKAEDAVHASGDTGIEVLCVRNDTLSALAGTDGDYAPCQVNADGALYVDTSSGGGVTPADDLTNPIDSSNSNTLNSEFDGSTWDRTRHSFSQDTTGITTNGAGTTVVMTTTPMSKFAMTIDRTAGSTDAVEIDLECNTNNANSIPVQIATVTSLTNEPVYTSIDGSPCESIQYNIVTVGSGNTLTVQLLAVR